MAEQYHLSPQTVSRYVRLAILDRELLDFVDDGRISFLAGVELSFLPADTQTALADFLNRDSAILTIKHAAALKEDFIQNGKMNESRIGEILSGTPSKKFKSEPSAKIKPKVWKKYIPAGASVKEVESTIEKALAFYFENGGGEQ